MLHVLDLRGAGDELASRLPRPDLGAPGPVVEVRSILAAVRERGDEAVRELTARFDGVELTGFSVDPAQGRAALARLEPALAGALRAASERIRAFHEHRPTPPGRFEADGISVEALELPVARAGVYVPGGRALYPSSVLMSAIPAKVAGVRAVALCVPPGRDGALPDEVLAAAALAEVDEIYSIGGAQAIGALAYGTETVGKVDVIVGAGSRLVSLAKQEVRGLVGVPAAFAGPSEVVVVADETVRPEFAAVDVVVQAEHGPDGLAWLVTWSQEVLEEVNRRVAQLVAASPRRSEIESTLAEGGYAVLVDGPQAALAVANAIAPEHLELCCAGAAALVPLVRNAGAVFLGPWSPAALGDYYAGPSHVLPTFASARFSSALGVEDFVRRVHVIEASAAGLQAAAPHVAAIAEAEGLAAHAAAVRLRCAAP